MNNAKTISKAKITLGAILLTFVMLLTLIATPLIAHAATTQKNHASYTNKRRYPSGYRLFQCENVNLYIFFANLL